MNVVNISYLSKQEIESSFRSFDKDQLEAAVARLIYLSEVEIADHIRNSNVCVCNYE